MAPYANTEQGRSAQHDVSAALAAARSGGSHAFDGAVRLHGDEGGNSLKEMARRDLDAALQLLAERAQYITGANGAVIALCREDDSDMLCRASAGDHAPALGTLLSTEQGLSGESVRARRPLRCDNTQVDRRVNHDVCRKLGIASVAVMPVVHDDEVLGVFELFSGKANAFGDRDLTALRRLSQLVETAVNLAEAPNRLQRRLKSAPANDSSRLLSSFNAIEEEETSSDTEWAVVEAGLPKPPQSTTVERNVAEGVKASTGKVPLLWSAVANGKAEKQAGADAAESQIPPTLRSLSKCEACGFPVSLGRQLCVECEEKKWRGQLKSAAPAATRTMAVAASAGASAASKSVPAIEAKLIDPANSSAVTITPEASKQESAPRAASAEIPSSEVILSAGLEPSKSWFSANKYILGAILAVAATVAVMLFLR